MVKWTEGDEEALM